MRGDVLLIVRQVEESAPVELAPVEATPEVEETPAAVEEAPAPAVSFSYISSPL